MIQASPRRRSSVAFSYEPIPVISTPFIKENTMDKSVEKLDLNELRNKIQAAENHGWDLSREVASGNCGGCDLVLVVPQNQADGACGACDVVVPHKQADGPCGGCDLLKKA
jgi:hypothetical protein